MECLSQSFEESFHVTLDETDVNLIHPRFSQYKQKILKNSQVERRKYWLISQKEKRSELHNGHREFCKNSDENLRKTHTNIKKFKNALMLSEWLVDVPEDLGENWIIKICPEGKRVVVVAEKGKTAAYGRNGKLVNNFKSLLPGGTKSSYTMRTIIDCIWFPESKEFHVLDVIHWGCPLSKCEAEFRFYWLSSKLQEIPALVTICKENWNSFKEVPVCTDIKQSLSIHPFYNNNMPKVDGILFYHKEGFYSSGKRCPLVTWLKPFMIPTIIRINVNPLYMNEIPPQYSKMEVTEISSDKKDVTEMVSVE